MKEFLKIFQFNPRMTGYTGVEREFFLMDSAGNYCPRQSDILNDTEHIDAYSKEISACQIETVTLPCPISNLREALIIAQKALDKDTYNHCLIAEPIEVAEDSHISDVMVDPHYVMLKKMFRSEQIHAICRINGTHVHIGMPDIETALNAFNAAVMSVPWLASIGDHSNGERLRFFSELCDIMPVQYSSVEDWYKDLKRRLYRMHPSFDWRMLRISKFGTLEFRMFGVTGDIDEIVKWAQLCYDICEPHIRDFL